MCAFVVFGFVFPYQVKRWVGEHLRNDLFCDEWDVKPQLSQSVTSNHGFIPKAYQDLFASICFEQPLVAKERLWSIYSELITVLYKCFYLLPYLEKLVYIVTVAGYSKTTVTVQADNTALLPLCWRGNGCYSRVSNFDIHFRRISKIMVTLDNVICKQTIRYKCCMFYLWQIENGRLE